MRQASLSAVIAAFAACLLTACGGSGGTPAGSNPVNNNPPPTTVGTGQESAFYSFNEYSAVGAVPPQGNGNAPVLGANGNFYGVSSCNGSSANGLNLISVGNQPQCAGAVYKMTPAGVASIVYQFTGFPTDGGQPGGLIQGSDGNLYGVTLFGGAYNKGTFYKLSTSGVETVLYSFGGSATDGVSPSTVIQASDGNFYGTSLTGGAYNETNCTLFFNNGGPLPSCVGYGDGAIFKITSSGQESLLYSFGATVDDAQIPAQIVQATDGNLYGVSTFGGLNNESTCVSNQLQLTTTLCGSGAMFEITLPGAVESLVYSFGGSSGDATSPTNLVQGSDGNFYGLSTYKFFEVTSAGSESVLYTFAQTSADAAGPIQIIPVSGGNFYGISTTGGTSSVGTIFKMTTAGTETVLYNFGASAVDANEPSGIVIGSNGQLYGVSLLGGANGNGAFFIYGLN